MSTPEILRMRCVRCGDWHEREVGDPYLPDICVPCFDKFLEHPNRTRFVDRYRRNAERHPTTLAVKRLWAEHAAVLPSGEAPW